MRKKKNIAKEEAELIVTFLGYYLGDPSVNKEKYVKYSPYIKEVGKASNVRFLRDYCINFYSEPDLFWYKTNLNFDYQDTNSYQIEMFVDELSSIGNENVNYVKTTAKGYVEGKRNPHSWSIIDPEDFMNWVENKKCLKR
nr:hypothetical protein BACY1_15420 [Tenacibaculum mesophilum]